MKTNDNIPEELLLLIERKPFDMLGIEEAALVVQYMNAEEYTMMHESIHIAKASFADTMAPHVSVSEALRRAFHEKHHAGPTAIKRLWQMPIGLGRVAALLLVSIVATAFLLKQDKATTVVYRLKTDTVFVAQQMPPVHLTDTVYITKVKYQTPRAITPRKRKPESTDREPTMIPSSESPLDRSKDHTTGTRMDEDEISKFFSYVDGSTTPM